MTWAIVAGTVIGASIGAGTSAASGQRGWGIGRGALIGGAGGALTGGLGGMMGGGAGSMPGIFSSFPASTAGAVPTTAAEAGSFSFAPMATGAASNVPAYLQPMMPTLSKVGPGLISSAGSQPPQQQLQLPGTPVPPAFPMGAGMSRQGENWNPPLVSSTRQPDLEQFLAMLRRGY